MLNLVVLLAALTFGQYDVPVRYQFQICSPIISKFYAWGKASDGRIIEIPIVNGEIPRITFSWETGQEVRTFTYNTGRQYTGGMICYVIDSNPPIFNCGSPKPAVREPAKPAPLPSSPSATSGKRIIDGIPPAPGSILDKSQFPDVNGEIDFTRPFPRYQN